MAHAGEVLVVGLLAECLSGIGCCAIGEGILHIVSYGLVEEVAGDIAVLVTETLTTLGVGCGLLDGFECLLGIKAFEALDDTVGYYGDGGVAYHTIGLIAPEVPYGEVALLVADVYHRGYELACTLGLDDGHEGLLSAVGVPKRVVGVVCGSALVYVVVGTAVVAIDVAEEHGGHHGVVHGGVEDALILFATLDAYA